MIVHITRDEGFVQAMGHRVALHLGGEPELKRRVLGTIAQLDAPPDEVRFERLEPGEDEEVDDDATEDPPGEAAAAAPELGAAEPKPGAPAPKAGQPKGKPPPRRGQKGKA